MCDQVVDQRQAQAAARLTSSEFVFSAKERFERLIQLGWLQAGLSSSPATWKIVSYDVPIGFPTGSKAWTGCWCLIAIRQ